MKVHELISILEDCDPEAEVLLSTQPHYPMEYAVAGIAVREEVLGDHGDEDDAEDDDAPESKDAPEGEGPYSEDLVLVTGSFHLVGATRPLLDAP